MTNIRRLFLLLSFLSLITPASAEQRETIKIAVRTDAKPFAWKDEKTGEFRGFLWHVCREAAERANYRIDPIGITAEQRGELLKSGSITGSIEPDMLCDPVTLTLDRLKRMTDWPLAYHPSPILFLAESSYVRTSRSPNKKPAFSGEPNGATLVKKMHTQCKTGSNDKDPSLIRMWPADPKAKTQYWGAVSGTTSSAPGQMNNALRKVGAFDTTEKGVPKEDRTQIYCGVQYPDHKAAAADFCAGKLTRYYGDIEIVKAAIRDAAAASGDKCDFGQAPKQ